MNRKSTIPKIESLYETLSPVEKTIADYFIHQADPEDDLSAKNVTDTIHVSETSLTRFSKKCGFSGYRTFIHEFKASAKQPDNIQQEITRAVLDNYEELLNKTYSLVNEEQFKHIAKILTEKNEVYIYGIGSSGFVANDMKLRFMRLGLKCEAITDADMMHMNSVLIDENSVLIGLTLSGETRVITDNLKKAKQNQAATIIFTANHKPDFDAYCDEVIVVATRENLSFGNRISPQFPLLVMIDIFYAHYLNTDLPNKKMIFDNTLSALNVVELSSDGGEATNE